VSLPSYHWWRTVFFLIPAVSLYTIACGIPSLLSTLVDRRGHAAHRWARRWARLILTTTGVAVERAGEPVTTDGPSAVYVANHASIYDIPVLFTALPCQLRIIAKAGLGRVPFIGWHLRLAGHLLVDRTNPGAAVFKRMRRMARQGASLVVFPEGSRSRDGSVGRFKGGMFLLAIESGLPIVPVSLINMRAVMPWGRLMVCPARARVVVHPPVATTGLSRDDARALAGRIQRIVAAGVAGGSPVTEVPADRVDGGRR
jgi:1-acyl-sn-glycerol-3-phosphate acyltransferase